MKKVLVLAVLAVAVCNLFADELPLNPMTEEGRQALEREREAAIASRYSGYEICDTGSISNSWKAGCGKGVILIPGGILSRGRSAFKYGENGNLEEVIPDWRGMQWRYLDEVIERDLKKLGMTDAEASFIAITNRAECSNLRPLAQKIRIAIRTAELMTGSEALSEKDAEKKAREEYGVGKLLGSLGKREAAVEPACMAFVNQMPVVRRAKELKKEAAQAAERESRASEEEARREAERQEQRAEMEAMREELRKQREEREAAKAEKERQREEYRAKANAYADEVEKRKMMYGDAMIDHLRINARVESFRKMDGQNRLDTLMSTRKNVDSDEGYVQGTKRKLISSFGMSNDAKQIVEREFEKGCVRLLNVRALLSAYEAELSAEETERWESTKRGMDELDHGRKSLPSGVNQ